MSPWPMMNEWGMPALYQHAMAYEFCQKLTRRGIRVPDIAVAGGFSTEDGVFKALAMGSPYVKAVCMGRALMIPGMVGKNIDQWIKDDNLPKTVSKHGTTVEEIFMCYEQVLDMEPDNEDARYNRDFVRNLKDQQEQQAQGDDQQSTENPGGQGQQSEGEGQQNEQGSEGSSQSERSDQEGEGSQRDDEMSAEDLEALQQELERAAEEAQQGDEPQQLSEEQLAQLRQEQEAQQAMEQWLRRIPDDPGGLLRRKFRYQYQRYRKDQEGNAVWPDDEVQPW
jgi:hypothetical protein